MAKNKSRRCQTGNDRRSPVSSFSNLGEALVADWLKKNATSVRRVEGRGVGIVASFSPRVRQLLAEEAVMGKALVLPELPASKPRAVRPLSDKEKGAIKVRDFLRTMGIGGLYPHIVEAGGTRVAFAALSDKEQKEVAKVVAGQANREGLGWRTKVFADLLWEPTAGLR